MNMLTRHRSELTRRFSLQIPKFLKGNVTLLTFLQYYRYWCSDTGKEYRLGNGHQWGIE